MSTYSKYRKKAKKAIGGVNRQIGRSATQIGQQAGHNAAKVSPYILGTAGMILGGPALAGVGAGIGTTLDRVYNDDKNWGEAGVTGLKAGVGTYAGATGLNYLANLGMSGLGYGATGSGAAGAAGGGAASAGAAGGSMATEALTSGASGASSYLPWIMGGSALLNAGLGYSSAGKAADAQTDAAKIASRTQLQMFEEGRADMAPWRTAGVNALDRLSTKVAAGPGEYTESPGYAFRTAEGQKAIERSAAARGGLLSGRAGKELMRYGQDYATNDYDNFLRRYYESLNPDQSLAGLGQTTASQGAAQGNAVAGQIGQNTLASGNAQAGGYINQSNAVTGGINSGINNYLMWKYLDKV